MKMHSYKELSDHDLDRIERVIDAATAGPWYSYVVGRDADATSTCIELGACNELGSFKSMEVSGCTVADQDFIASARQDLPLLLREVRLLRIRLESMRRGVFGMREQSPRGVFDDSGTALPV
jgi:hypothetical protein